MLLVTISNTMDSIIDDICKKIIDFVFTTSISYHHDDKKNFKVNGLQTIGSISNTCKKINAIVCQKLDSDIKFTLYTYIHSEDEFFDIKTIYFTNDKYKFFGYHESQHLVAIKYNTNDDKQVNGPLTVKYHDLIHGMKFDISIVFNMNSIYGDKLRLSSGILHTIYVTPFDFDTNDKIILIYNYNINEWKMCHNLFF